LSGILHRIIISPRFVERKDRLSQTERRSVQQDREAGMKLAVQEMFSQVYRSLFAKHDAFSAACAAAFINGRCWRPGISEFGYGLLAQI